MPLTVQCTIHSAVKLKTTEPLDFPESEKCARHISLKWLACMFFFGGGGGAEVHAPVLGSARKKRKKESTLPGQWVCVWVSAVSPD